MRLFMVFGIDNSSPEGELLEHAFRPYRDCILTALRYAGALPIEWDRLLQILGSGQDDGGLYVLSCAGAEDKMDFGKVMKTLSGFKRSWLRIMLIGIPHGVIEYKPKQRRSAKDRTAKGRSAGSRRKKTASPPRKTAKGKPVGKRRASSPRTTRKACNHSIPALFSAGDHPMTEN